ncbi:MAG TPA: phosphatidate cytidylyltransferase [Thermoanaerobaculia bacterium]|nr:phosphatidate cytidylyltransferase [Thermoanaerobaculia bacterium]
MFARRFAREITALVALPFVIAIIGWGPLWLYTALIVIALTLALWEFLALGQTKGYPVQKIASILLLFVLLWTFLDDRVSVEVGVFAILLVIPALYVFARTPIEEALPASAVCALGTLYVGMLGGALLRLRIDFSRDAIREDGSLDIGAKLIFFLLVAVWASDSGAYYVGKRFGRHRLSPRVSPKKTIEGGVGGFVTSLIAAGIVHATFFPEFPLHHALIAAGLLCVGGIIGDLAESLWKRSADVKDSGVLIPGHGGFLDRIDSILFTAPILYAYWFALNEGWPQR